jgi:hypothetical protein
MNYRSIIAALAAPIMLAGCSANSVSPSSATAIEEATTVSHATRQSFPFVGNNPDSGAGSVTVYDAPNSDLVSTITNGVRNPSVAVHPRGVCTLQTDTLAWALQHLYVANNPYSSCGSVRVYDVGSDKLDYTLGQSNGVCLPTLLAICSDGNLYVLNYTVKTLSGGPSVTVYPIGKTMLLRTINAGLEDPTAMTLDSSANLYVANFTDVTVYASGTTSFLRTITDGVQHPTSLAFGPVGASRASNYSFPDRSRRCDRPRLCFSID